MERKIYEMTEKDHGRCSIKTEQSYKDAVAAFDVNKPALGKKFGLKKRDHALMLLRQTPEYVLGMRQGALDLAHKLAYQADTNDSGTFQNAYNLGYHNGYTSPSNLRDLIAHNPNFAHLRG